MTNNIVCLICGQSFDKNHYPNITPGHTFVCNQCLQLVADLFDLEHRHPTPHRDSLYEDPFE